MYFASDSKVRHVRAVGIFFIGQAGIVSIKAGLQGRGGIPSQSASAPRKIRSRRLRVANISGLYPLTPLQCLWTPFPTMLK